jgi:hypothetical protein
MDRFVPGSGVPITPKLLGTVISLRLPSPLAADLRDAANARGVTVSDMLRDLIEKALGTPVGWRCEHFNMTSLPGVLGRPMGFCGCEMQPVYHPQEVAL